MEEEKCINLKNYNTLLYTVLIIIMIILKCLNVFTFYNSY